MNKENLKELARTILATLFMVITAYFCFLAAANTPESDTPEPVVGNGGGAHAGFHSVAASRSTKPAALAPHPSVVPHEAMGQPLLLGKSYSCRF